MVSDGDGETVEVVAGDVETPGVVVIIRLSALVVIGEMDGMRFILSGLCIEPHFNARILVACVEVPVFGQVSEPFLVFVSVGPRPSAYETKILCFLLRVVAVSHQVQAADVIAVPLADVVLVDL